MGRIGLGLAWDGRADVRLCTLFGQRPLALSLARAVFLHSATR